MFRRKKQDAQLKELFDVVYVKGLFFTMGENNAYNWYNQLSNYLSDENKYALMRQAFSQFEIYRGFEYDAVNDNKFRINDIGVIIHDHDYLSMVLHLAKDCFQLGSVYAMRQNKLFLIKHCEMIDWKSPIIYIPSKKYLLYGKTEYLIQDYPKEKIDFFVESETKGMKKLYEDYRKTENYIKQNFKQNI